MFLVPPPTPTYFLHLHIYISAFVFRFVVVVIVVVVAVVVVVFFQLQLPCWELLSLQGPVLSRGESTPHISALVQCTLQMALKPEGYITLSM